MTTKLLADGVEVIALALDDRHYHVLARFTDHRPRHWIGRAKYHASMVLRADKPQRRLWAAGCRALPITDRPHQENVFRYIVKHGRRGAVVWTFRDPKPDVR